MKIGIDLDDVIADFFESLLKFYHNKFGKLHKRDEFKEWKWWPVWGVSKEESTKIVNEFHETHKLEDIPLMEHALNSLNHLLKDNEIFIITSRPVRFKPKVESWIKHHLGDLKIEIIHSSDFHKGQGATKAEICREKGISIMIEDSPDTAEDCANKGIEVILFDNPWNREGKHNSITRVKNWLEALEVIEHIKSSKNL
jgi:uncharacterized HAD superfamily protein